jgi:thiamine-monophosphate kinase
MPSSEIERVRWLRSVAGGGGRPPAGARAPAGGKVLLGIGDDAALLRPPAGHAVVLTVDAQVEGVHFLSGWLTPAEIGARAVAASASDLAAMAALPAGVLISITLPAAAPDSLFRGLFRGALAEARRAGLAVLGGNLSSGPLSVSVTAVGSVLPREPLTRSGARAGDGIFVTGWPGRAAIGRAVIESGSRGVGRFGGRAASACRRAFAAPSPRIEEARRLARSLRPRAMIDISDGLSRDLAHLLGSGIRAGGGRVLGAALDAGLIRSLIEEEGCGELARRLGLDPLEAALSGGEDYELLLAAPARGADSIALRFRKSFGLPLTRVGSVERRPGLRLVGEWLPARGRKISASGYDHFTARGGSRGPR